MAKPISNLRKTQQMLNQLTVGIVTVFGVISAFTIFSSPISMNSSDVMMAPSEGLRGPASVGVTNEMGKQVTVDVLTIECGKDIEVLSQSPQVRLRGSICAQESQAQLKSSSIKNKDNKDVATVFLMNRDFTTDVIHLSKDHNELTIVNKLSNGETETRLLKIRLKKM
ncbi:MAG: hypothetical protein AB7F59_00225 [Bdellovibrionales bacterium]